MALFGLSAVYGIAGQASSGTRHARADNLGRPGWTLKASRSTARGKRSGERPRSATPGPRPDHTLPTPTGVAEVSVEPLRGSIGYEKPLPGVAACTWQPRAMVLDAFSVWPQHLQRKKPDVKRKPIIGAFWQPIRRVPDFRTWRLPRGTGGAELLAAFFQAVAADLAVQRGALDAQDAGGAALVPAGVVERGEDVAALDVGQRGGQELLARRPRSRPCRRPWRASSAAGRPRRSPGRGRGPPPARSRSSARGRCPASDRSAVSRWAAGVKPAIFRPVSALNLFEEVVGQQGDVLGPLAQGGHDDLQDAQAEVEVAAEAGLRPRPFPGRGWWRRSRGRRRWIGLLPPTRSNGMPFQHAEELGLDARGSFRRSRRASGCRGGRPRTCRSSARWPR